MFLMENDWVFVPQIISDVRTLSFLHARISRLIHNYQVSIAWIFCFLYQCLSSKQVKAIVLTLYIYYEHRTIKSFHPSFFHCCNMVVIEMPWYWNSARELDSCRHECYWISKSSIDSHHAREMRKISHVFHANDENHMHVAASQIHSGNNVWNQWKASDFSLVWVSHDSELRIGVAICGALQGFIMIDSSMELSSTQELPQILVVCSEISVCSHGRLVELMSGTACKMSQVWILPRRATSNSINWGPTSLGF